MAEPRTKVFQLLQAGRGVAALMVLLFHAADTFALPKYFDAMPFGEIFGFGYAGVYFFFVLSGFIIFHVHEKDLGRPSTLVSYLSKRFSRIYLPYWIVLAGIIPVFFLIADFGKGYEREPAVLIRSILLLPGPDVKQQILSVAWTLVFEVFFYLVFALFVADVRLGALAIVAWIAGIVLASDRSTYPWNFLASPYHLLFLAGVGVAWFVARYRVRWPWLWLLGGVLGFFGTGLDDVYGHTLNADIGYMFGSVASLLGLIELERTQALTAPRWLAFLGDASYSIYLVHYPLLSLVAKILKRINFGEIVPSQIVFFLLVSITLALSLAFHLFIEAPILAWTKNAWRRKTTP